MSIKFEVDAFSAKSAFCLKQADNILYELLELIRNMKD